MATIRAFERADVPAVAGLIRANMRAWRHDERFLEATLVDYPWADPELPSLVAVGADGEVLGFVGSQVRRVRVDDRELRGVCVSHLVVAPDRGAGPAGALLLSRLLAGPQDLSWSDSAIDTVVRMWRTFGGHLDHARVCDWMLVLRPLRWARGTASAIVRRRSIGREQVPVGALPVHALARRAAANEPAAPEVRGSDVDVDEIVDSLPDIRHDVRLQVGYDSAYLSHLFAQVEATSGPLVRRLVRAGKRPIGWYAYLRRPSGVGRVLHLDAASGLADAVMGELVSHARATGSNLLAGRMEPHLEDPLRARMAVLGFARRPVIHTHDDDVRLTLMTSASRLTQLDSEWFVT